MNEEVVKTDNGVEQAVPATSRRKMQAPPPIELLYRQVYDSLDSKIYGFESQIRINDKKLGTLTPDLFVPIAERSNQIVELGKWSFVEMADMIRRQTEKGRVIPRMFMPVAAKYLCKSYFVDNLTRQMEKASMAADSVCVVLQTQDLLNYTANAKEAFDKVREKGIKLAIAGVGTDGLSLAQLSDLAPDFLILDAAFVAGVETDERTKTVVNTLSELGASLGAQLIAQGVDSKELTAALQTVGCSLMQGNYFGEFEREAQMF